MNAGKRPTDPAAVKRSRQLRGNSTDAEAKLWNVLRNRRTSDAKFRRQVPVGRFFTDFCCREHHLIVELDGGQHEDDKKYDETRTHFLEGSGYRVLRFWNNDVLTNIEGVLQVILDAIERGNASP